MRLKFYQTITFLFLSLSGFSVDLSGHILDEESKKPIPYATLLFVDLNTGVVCDENGQFTYSGELPQNTQVKISAIGYETILTTLPVDNNPTVFYLHASHIELEEFVVATTGTLQRYSIVNVEKRSLDELATIQNNDLGEAVANIPSVYNLSTGNGISKPVIRGLSGMRVITYLNGLRIENQQWGGDHGMGINENGIASVEVIKGPASLLYGADALGGVLYLSEESFANQNAVEAYYNSKFESNGMKFNNGVGLKLSGKRLKFNLFASNVSSADYQLPNQQFVKNSRYKQNDIKTSLGFHHKNWVFNARYNFVNNRIGIPGHTHDSIFSLASFISSEQARSNTVPAQVITNHFALIENNFNLKKSTIKLKTGFTSNRLQEFDEKVSIPGIDMYLDNYTYSINWDRKLGKNHQLIVGSQGMFQQTINQPKAEGQIIPNSSSTDLGAYGILQGAWKDWNYQAGVRFDQREVNVSDEDYTSSLSSVYQGLNYSGGINRSFGHFKIRTCVSSGFRPPHSSELLADGVHHGTMRYEIGKRDLTSEKATQIDFSAEYQSEHLFVSINPYYSWINNYIYISPLDTSYSGYPVYLYEQEEKATLIGGDVSFHYHPHFAHNLHLEHNTSFIQAERADGSPLPLIPQTRLNTLLRYQFDSEKKVSVEYIALQHFYFFDQNRVSTYEITSDGYHLLNLGMSLDIQSKFPIKVQAGIKNLLNTNFINHLSRLKPYEIPSPGRNFYISLKFNLQTQKNKSYEN